MITEILHITTEVIHGIMSNPQALINAYYYLKRRVTQ